MYTTESTVFSQFHYSEKSYLFKRHKKNEMTRMWLHQVFAVMFFLLIVKETAGYACSCKKADVNCSSVGLSVFPAIEMLEGCEDFKKIDLSNNKFTDFPSDDVRNAETIIFSNNFLKEFQTEVYLETKVLDVSQNQIQKIQMRNLGKLEELYASQNSLNTNIEYLTGTCKNLRILDMSQNQLNSLAPVGKCKNISQLEVSQNNIIDLPKEFKNFTLLKSMNLSWNALDVLSHLPVNLENLTVSHNQLTGIQSHFFESSNKLTNLDLSYNSLEELDANSFRKLVALKRLDLSNNTLRVVPPLQLSNDVRNVLLNGNNITSINANDVMKLLGSGDVQRQVDVRANPIRNLDTGLHALVQHLDTVGASIDIYHHCECMNATLGNATLLLRVIDQDRDGQCWIDIARQTTTTSTTEKITTTTIATELIENVEVDNETNTNATEAIKNNNTESANETNIDIMQDFHFMSSLGAAKLSFLAFLLVTLLILIIINCIVGDPVVDDRWWEEKVGSDRVT